MRLDSDHVRKLRAAIVGRGGNGHVDINVERLSLCMQWLSLWEGGLLMDALMRAASASKLSREQRVLLAMFVHDRDEEVANADC